MGEALARRTRYHQKTLTGAAGTTSSIQPTLSDAANAVLVVPASGRADLLRNALTVLNNKITWLRQYVFGTHVGGQTSLTWTPQLLAYADGDWADDLYASLTTTGDPVFTEQRTKGARYAVFGVPPLPPGLFLRQLSVRVGSPDSHGGSIAGMTMPNIALVSVNSSGTRTELISQLDTSSTAAAYEADHTITTTTFSALTTSSTALQLHVRGESGTNSIDNSFRVYLATLSFWFEP